MRIMDAINRLDTLKFNTYTNADKIAWLSQLDGKVKQQIFDTHEGGDGVSFAGYTSKTPLDTELLIPAPFDDVYLKWMEAQIDYHNGEYDKYNASILMYNTALTAFANWYNKNNMPLSKGRFLF